MRPSSQDDSPGYFWIGLDMRRFLRLNRADFLELEAVLEAWESFDRMLRGLGGGALSLARRRVSGGGRGGVADEDSAWLLAG